MSRRHTSVRSQSTPAQESGPPQTEGEDVGIMDPVSALSGSSVAGDAEPITPLTVADQAADTQTGGELGQ